MGISRSSFYAPPADKPDDGKIVGEMQAIADEFEAYGYRRMTAELRHRDWW
jgi:putative transposase